MEIMGRTYERIYAENYQSIYSFFYMLTQNKDISDLLTKRTFVHAFRRIFQYNGICEIKTWLLSVAVNRFMDYIKKEKTELNIQLFITNSDASLLENATEQWNRKIMTTDLYPFLKKLSLSERTILLLHLFGNVTYIELNLLLNVSVESVELLFIKTTERIKGELFND